MVKFDIEDAAVHKAVEVPTLLHGPFQHLGGKIYQGNAIVFVEIEQSIRVRGDESDIDGI